MKSKILKKDDERTVHSFEWMTIRPQSWPFQMDSFLSNTIVMEMPCPSNPICSTMGMVGMVLRRLTLLWYVSTRASSVARWPARLTMIFKAMQVVNLLDHQSESTGRFVSPKSLREFYIYYFGERFAKSALKPDLSSDIWSEHLTPVVQ